MTEINIVSYLKLLKLVNKFIARNVNYPLGLSTQGFNMIRHWFTILQTISMMFMIAQSNGCSVIILLVMETIMLLIAALVGLVRITTMGLWTYMSMNMRMHLEMMTDTVCWTVIGLIKKILTQEILVSVLLINTEIQQISSAMIVLRSIIMLVIDAMRMFVKDARLLI